MMNNMNKIEILDNTSEPSEYVQRGGEVLADMAMVGGRNDHQIALDALLLAAAEIVVHNRGNVTTNMEAARQKLSSLLEFSVKKHATCIEELKERGIQTEEVD